MSECKHSESEFIEDLAEWYCLSCKEVLPDQGKTMSESKHTPTPWYCEEIVSHNKASIIDSDSNEMNEPICMSSA
jgi:hypothetical protein